MKTSQQLWNRRQLRKLQSAGRDGMLLCSLGLAVLTFTHPGREALAAIVLGLAGIFCARLAPRRTGTRSSAGRRPVSRMVNLGRFSPECLDGNHGACSGVGCDDTCGHPGRSRSSSSARNRRAANRLS